MRLNKNRVPIAPIVKKLFRETYGVEDDTLYQDDALCKRIRSAIKALRFSYKNNICVTDYSDEEIRKAYMIAYYPYFIAPAHCIAVTYLKPNLPDSDGNWAFFAGGPCPELLGVASVDMEINPPARVITLDSEANWFPYQELTHKLCTEHYNFESGLTFYRGFNIGSSLPSGSKCRDDLRNANIFFMQNYLSHLSPAPDNVNEFIDWFLAWVREAKGGALFVFIDLNYGSTEEVFNQLCDEECLSQNGLDIIDAYTPAAGSPLEILHGNTTQAISDNIFTDEDGLFKKFFDQVLFRRPAEENDSRES